MTRASDARTPLQTGYATRTGWEIIETAYDPDRIVASGSSLLVGNGYLGYRGTCVEWDADRYVACTVADTYDMADGGHRELCNAPNGLWSRLTVEGRTLDVEDQGVEFHERTLDLRDGTLARHTRWRLHSGAQVDVETERFASYEDLHLVPLRYVITTDRDLELTLWTGIDGRVWSLKGDHFAEVNSRERDERLVMETAMRESGLPLVVATAWRVPGGRPTSVETIESERHIGRRMTLHADADRPIVLERAMAVASGRDMDDPAAYVQAAVDRAMASGYESSKRAHQAKWEAIWNAIDVEIDGDLEAQTLTRFNLYHATIATPAHADHLPIGARGLSCQAYQGAAFWDQEIFNLPMHLHTRPELARNLIIYRHRTLDGAREKARSLGYRGAFYPWMSDRDGAEICPSYFFRDVSGRWIRSHFNDWQIHISPDVVYALWGYYRATGDWTTIVDHGAEIAFEVARFLASRAHLNVDKARYELIRVVGPDEYHENVDHNAFTNHQAGFALDVALQIYDDMTASDPNALTALRERIRLTESEVDHWRDLAERLYRPQPDPDTGLIEQFAGYFAHEDVRPEDLEDRLLDPGEYWGWPLGVAVETQVIKQADVAQLLNLHPQSFDADVHRANFAYYEPRTHHASSLSRSAYANLACWLDQPDQAYELFMRSCGVDLYNANRAVVGGTFIGGIHTAACGATWLMIAHGFAGLRFDKHRGLSLYPRLPSHWQRLAFSLIVRGQRFRAEIYPQYLKLAADAGNDAAVTLYVWDQAIDLEPSHIARVPTPTRARERTEPNRLPDDLLSG